MTAITLPIWVFALSLGVPSLFLVCLLGFFLRKIKSSQKNEAADIWVQQMGNVQFHDDLLYSQIDTIFNSLGAILESERLKVQALLKSGHPRTADRFATTTETVKAMDTPTPQPVDDGDTAPEESQRVMHAEADREQEEITLSSGLSQSEIELAKKMRSRTANNPVRRLEAVA